MVDIWSLTPKERKLYTFLAENEIATTAKIQEHVYGWTESLAGKVDYTNVRMCVMRLKKKGVNIQTIRGLGFKLVK